MANVVLPAPFGPAMMTILRAISEEPPVMRAVHTIGPRDHAIQEQCYTSGAENSEIDDISASHSRVVVNWLKRRGARGPATASGMPAPPSTPSGAGALSPSLPPWPPRPQAPARLPSLHAACGSIVEENIVDDQRHGHCELDIRIHPHHPLPPFVVERFKRRAAMGATNILWRPVPRPAAPRPGPPQPTPRARLRRPSVWAVAALARAVHDQLRHPHAVILLELPCLAGGSHAEPVDSARPRRLNFRQGFCHNDSRGELRSPQAASDLASRRSLRQRMSRSQADSLPRSAKMSSPSTLRISTAISF